MYAVDRTHKKILYSQEFQHHGITGQRWGVITSFVGKYYIPKGARAYNKASDRMNSIHGQYIFEHPKATGVSKSKYHNPPKENLQDLHRLTYPTDDMDNRMAINHPNDGYSSNGRHYNCQNCALAFEMQQRGYDVCARPRPDGSNVGDISKYFQNAKFNSPMIKNYPPKVNKMYGELMKAKNEYESLSKSGAPEAKIKLAEKEYHIMCDRMEKEYADVAMNAASKMFDMIKEQGNSRGIVVQGLGNPVEVSPSERTTMFHAANYECKGETIKIYDVQVGKNYANDHRGLSGKAALSYFSSADPRDLYFLRTDNLDVSPSITNAVYSRRR